MPELGDTYTVREEVLGLQPGTVLTVVGHHGGKIAFRTQGGATAVRHPRGGRYVSIAFSPTEVREYMEVGHAGQRDG